MTEPEAGTAEIAWGAGDVPVSRQFGDPYYSLESGIGEARHVFLGGNGLPGRFRDGFAIAELGFGTGLNLLVTQAAWIAAGAPGRLHYTSFEAFVLSAGAMARALAAFPELAPLVPPLLAARERGAPTADLPGGVTLRLVIGDARETLPGWAGCADAWYLDGFAPARNPEMWEAPLLAAVAARMPPGGTLATYSAAGAVRRALAAAGLEVARVQGYGRKRHMTVARKP